MARRRFVPAWAALAVPALMSALAACTVGPDYVRPAAPASEAWRTDSYWRLAAPSHAPLTLDWWRAFGEEELDALEGQALAQNQTLAAASAHETQARATLAATAAQRVPEIDLQGQAERLKISKNRPLTNYSTPSQSTVQNLLTLGPSATYDVDLFGRIRREVEGARASAQQAADDLANARLIVTADLATDYFALRELDAEIDVLDRSVRLQEKALEYVKAEHDLGSVSGLDLYQQQAHLDATRVQATLLVNQRAQYEHAIAALVGTPAPQFSIAPSVAQARVPSIAIGIPSDLLQRRPDIASAERAMAAANAKIGEAKAAFFPSLVLTPGIGWEATAFSSLLSAPSLMWTLGAQVGQAVFDGGRRQANVNFASAGYAQAEANYRQTVLDAFQQVQDGVTGLSVLDAASKQAHAAVEDAQRLLSLANDRYSGGLVAYLDVIDAQQSLLTSQRTEVQIHGQRMALCVALVKALGGGWEDKTVARNASKAGQTDPIEADRSNRTREAND